MRETNCRSAFGCSKADAIDQNNDFARCFPHVVHKLPHLPGPKDQSIIYPDTCSSSFLYFNSVEQILGHPELLFKLNNRSCVR